MDDFSLKSRQHLPWEILHDELFVIHFALVVLALVPGEGTAARLLSYRLPTLPREISFVVYLFRVPLYEWLLANRPALPILLDERALFRACLLVLMAFSETACFFIEGPACRWLRALVVSFRSTRARAVALLAILPLVAVGQTPSPVHRLPGIKGPAVVVFLAKGCPCNVRCMPDLELLSNELGRAIPLVGVVVGCSSTDLPTYRAGLGCSFSLVSDAKGVAANAAGAVCSLDLALVSANGKVVGLWEGVGRKTIGRLSLELRRKFSAKDLLDPNGFSETVQTGCLLKIPPGQPRKAKGSYIRKIDLDEGASLLPKRTMKNARLVSKKLS